MVCSKYPKEYRHYETILKRKCLRKLKYNVWERKTRWILLEKADHHYRFKLLHKHIRLWVTYLNECYKKKINRRAADAHYEEKLKSRGISALKKNIEENWMLTKICKKKFEWNLKFKCWHQWKHYVEKRLKVKEVKLLADRIRVERLRIKFLYLWLFRFNEKRSLENAYKAAAAKHEAKLTKKYFKAWKIFTTKHVWIAKIEKLAVACYEDKLKERFIRCWKLHTFQKRRYRYQMEIIRKFYENYLLKNYISRWLTAYKKLLLERKICNFNLAVNFYEGRLLERSFRVFRRVREAKRTEVEKVEKFRDIYVRIYLDLWLEKSTEKILWNNLEYKATEWREDFLRELYLTKLFDRYQKKVEEREEMANIVKYSNAIIVDRAFRGWRLVTERKTRSKIELENASELYTRRLVKKTLQKWQKFVKRKSRKKMAAAFYRFTLLSRVMDQWNVYSAERKIKLEEARSLEQKHNTVLLKTTFQCWKNEADVSKSKLKSAIEFNKKSNLSKYFSAWSKISRIKAANKKRYNRNKTTLNDTLVKNFILLWHEMLSVKRTLNKKLQEFQLQQQNRCLRSHYGTWLKFVNKMKTVRQNVETYPQLRSEIFLEQYLDILLEAVRIKRDFDKKVKLAEEAEERMLKRRYLGRWQAFVSWKRERILKCMSEDMPFVSREVFIPFVASQRRKPIIPDYLKANFNYEQFEGLTQYERRKIRDNGINSKSFI